ncbi:Uncharacterised protein [Mycobacterium tuberculosis]|nr:Uncharacterised protein [Mycobacterium tuberculosis]
MDGLTFENDHPQIAVGEVAPPLHGGHQLLVVQMALAEIPPDQWPGHDFALADAVVSFVIESAGQQAVERPAVGVHGPECGDLVGHDFGRGPVVELGQLIDHQRRAFHDAGFHGGFRITSEAPDAGGPVAGVVAHGGQKRNLFGQQVSHDHHGNHRDHDRQQQRRPKVGGSDRAVVAE